MERVAWLLLAALHAPPFAAFFAPRLITSLYGVASGSDAFALLHHRAALFGLVVVVAGWCAFSADQCPLGVIVVAGSMMSFLGLYLLYGQPVSLRSIALVDLVGLVPLIYVAWKAFGQ